ncbi:N-6 DNA methylase [Streptomyces caatingaensis]|uniref:N-6 DNA methylase n=1 Tax=Streptomyces caatingaensis TaxID=1678637 RepID=A0A0K9XJR3_9ACTN|nr:N-6 DNA methylase [Streptomyces caatingaensis]KNB53629.1 N-6 DNA methylase [Streptomyces caatingaensis]
MASARTPASARTVPVTLAEIARIAGVGRAAVSNWRRRHDSFPERIGGSDASPHFSLSEVEEWLRAKDKLKEAGDRELLWPRFEALSSRAESGLAIAEAGRRMRGGRERPAPSLSTEAQELVAEAVRLGRRDGSRQTFEFLLRRWLDTNVRQVSTTPPPLASLMTTVALCARPKRTGGPLTVLDPACGTGHLLTAVTTTYGQGPTRLVGCDREPALAALAAARLRFLLEPQGPRPCIAVGDSLRSDPHPGVRADIVLCNPPFSEREWGHEELATDSRWAHGLPPRTEPELAWVQHCLARLRPGGTAVLLLPPAVASRRAGRRIRSSLLRTGHVKAVIALPPGCAQPHGVSLHLWVLRAPTHQGGSESTDDVLLVDATEQDGRGARDGRPDWDGLHAFIRQAVALLHHPGGILPEGVARLAVLDLLDDDVNLTPGRHTAPPSPADAVRLASTWGRFGLLAESLRETSTVLAGLDLTGAKRPTTTVGELARAGALLLRGGHQPMNDSPAKARCSEASVPLLTIADLPNGGRTGGRPTLAARPDLVLAEPGDVVVAGVVRVFDAWVHEGPPIALGPQLYALRVVPERLDARFLAGCLRAPSNGRQAGTHASSSARVDIRKLQVLQLPLKEQRHYGETFGHMVALMTLLDELGGVGRDLLNELSEGLVAGRLVTGA